jgi:protein-disulfide isomerase
MYKALLKGLALLSVIIFATGCAKIIENTLKNNPDIVFEAMKKEPVKFIDTLNEAGQQYQSLKAAEEFEKQFADPKQPEIDEKRAIRGEKSAPITIVEYSDFQCGYCGRASQTVEKLMESEYKGKIRFIYKHLPVTGAPMSKPAAEAFEAIAMIDPVKAYEFHDKAFEKQRELRTNGEDELKKIVREVMGSDASKVFEKTESDEVQARLEADRAEAMKFQINGTPAFIVNGVFLNGAQPIEKFKQVIDRHLEAKK